MNKTTILLVFMLVANLVAVVGFTLTRGPREQDPVVEVITGLEPMYEVGLTFSITCPEHSVHNYAIRERFVGYGIQNLDIADAPVEYIGEEELTAIVK